MEAKLFEKFMDVVIDNFEHFTSFEHKFQYPMLYQHTFKYGNTEDPNLSWVDVTGRGRKDIDGLIHPIVKDLLEKFPEVVIAGGSAINIYHGKGNRDGDWDFYVPASLKEAFRAELKNHGLIHEHYTERSDYGLDVDRFRKFAPKDEFGSDVQLANIEPATTWGWNVPNAVKGYSLKVTPEVLDFDEFNLEHGRILEHFHYSDHEAKLEFTSSAEKIVQVKDFGFDSTGKPAVADAMVAYNVEPLHGQPAVNPTKLSIDVIYTDKLPTSFIKQEFDISVCKTCVCYDPEEEKFKIMSLYGEDLKTMTARFAFSPDMRANAVKVGAMRYRYLKYIAKGYTFATGSTLVSRKRSLKLMMIRKETAPVLNIDPESVDEKLREYSWVNRLIYESERSQHVGKPLNPGELPLVQYLLDGTGLFKQDSLPYRYQQVTDVLKSQQYENELERDELFITRANIFREKTCIGNFAMLRKHLLGVRNLHYHLRRSPHQDLGTIEVNWLDEDVLEKLFDGQKFHLLVTYGKRINDEYRYYTCSSSRNSENIYSKEKLNEMLACLHEYIGGTYEIFSIIVSTIRRRPDNIVRKLANYYSYLDCEEHLRMQEPVKLSEKFVERFTEQVQAVGQNRRPVSPDVKWGPFNTH